MSESYARRKSVTLKTLLNLSVSVILILLLIVERFSDQCLKCGFVYLIIYWHYKRQRFYWFAFCIYSQENWKTNGGCYGIFGDYQLNPSNDVDSNIYSIRSVLFQVALVHGFRRRDVGSPLHEDPFKQG